MSYARYVLLFVFLLGIIGPIDRSSWGEDLSKRTHLVMLIAEREYQTEESLRQFAKRHLAGFKISVVVADPDDKNVLMGIEAIKTADVLLVSVRRRTLPDEQLQLIRDYVSAGKPVIGIRTANHAFCLRGKEPPADRAQWLQWDKDVFGGNYTNHYGNKLKTTVHVSEDSNQTQRDHTHRDAELLKGIDATKTYPSGGSLYKVAPLAQGAQVYLTGKVKDNPFEPVAWTYTRADGGKSFYTSLGHVDDFRADVLPQLLMNAIEWATTKQTVK